MGPRTKKSDGLTAKIGKATAILVAIGALLAAAQAIIEKISPMTCKVWSASWCSNEVTQADVRASSVAIGATGWIYVGTRVGDVWKTTPEEGAEPALTLKVDGLPASGQTYNLSNAVHLRAGLPEVPPDGSRPPMTDSKGAIGTGSQVKVDSVRFLDLTKPIARTWIWAHVTYLRAGSE